MAWKGSLLRQAEFLAGARMVHSNVVGVVSQNSGLRVTRKLGSRNWQIPLPNKGLLKILWNFSAVCLNAPFFRRNQRILVPLKSRLPNRQDSTHLILKPQFNAGK